MEVVIKQLDTRSLIVEHIVDGIEKVCKSGSDKGSINLSLDLTRPERVGVEVYSGEDGDSLWIALTYIKSGEVICSVNGLEYGNEQSIEAGIRKLIDAAESWIRRQSDYSLQIEYCKRIQDDMRSLREILAPKSDAFVQAHKREANDRIAQAISDLESVLEFING